MSSGKSEITNNAMTSMLTQAMPTNISMNIEHQPHASLCETVEEWLDDNKQYVFPEDREEMIRTGQIWSLQWFPRTPAGNCIVVAATLDRCLELARAV